jgi:hypothetical protein
MKLATIKDAPGALNTNDKAMWVLGHNAAVETLDADAERVAASLREILNLCEIGDVDEDTEALGWGNAIKAARAALSACGVPPSAPAMPPRLLQSLARRNFRAPTDMDDLIAMAANIIAEDGFVIERLQAKLADGVIVVGEAQQPGETYLAYLARCEREGRNTKPQAKDPDLCREPGCSNPTKTPVSAWCREHDRAGGAPHA